MSDELNKIADQEQQSVQENEQSSVQNDTLATDESLEEKLKKARKPKKEKKEKKPLTKEQKRKRTLKGFAIAGVFVLAFGVLFGTFAIVNVAGVNALMDMTENFSPVDYEGEQLVPMLDEDGYWTFTTDEDLKILQFTDVHIGAGFGSQKKDSWALNAVAAMITGEKPDLVIVTGDIAYPVPFQAGTFNNLNATKIFASLMENLGVYWTFTFGNHDTEAYSYFDREDICDYYESQNFQYCLFQRGRSDIAGYGNTIIKVQNNDGIITQALTMFDSHSYTDGDALGMLWKYDNIHQDQVNWYSNTIATFNAKNSSIKSDATAVKSLAFFHIPLREYRNAWKEYTLNGYKDTDDVKYVYGVMGESNKESNGEQTYGVYCGMGDDSLFETGAEIGLQGIFCGHDHYNNFSVEYKGIRLTYGMSIDYLAYSGIWKEQSQRGCTIITVSPDGSFDCEASNYYATNADGTAKYSAKYYKQ